MKTAILTFIFILSVAVSSAQLLHPATKPEKQWETDPGLKIPESVLYDTATGIIFVSNIDGSPAAKDSSGFIATLSTDGKILKADWVTGIDAPKGMGILKNHLFVSNIDEIVEIDIPTATIVKRYPVEGSKFLNDVATDPITGMIFITDSGLGQVYVLFDGKVNLWLQGDMFKGANGLCLHDSLLYIGTGNNVLQADINTGEVVVYLPNTGGVDGIYMTSDDKLIFSDWRGSVFISEMKRKPVLLMSTTAQKINAADFGVIVSKNMILIPTFADNKVVSYTLDVIK